MGDMTDARTDVVRRVEDASLSDLRKVDIEDVYVQMDWLLESRPTPLDLYNRWERQNWMTQDLDFSEDATQWASMEGYFEGLRTELQRSFTLFFVGEQAVTDTLSPLVHAAPDEPSRIFLSTQLVDEARHAVFFSRFFDEVIGIPGGLSAALAAVKDKTVGGFRHIFDNDLVEATDNVRMNPHDYGAWVEGITIYHMIIEGMLALTGQKFLLGIIRELGILPGFYTGFTAVARRRVAPRQLWRARPDGGGRAGPGSARPSDRGRIPAARARLPDGGRARSQVRDLDGGDAPEPACQSLRIPGLLFELADEKAARCRYFERGVRRHNHQGIGVLRQGLGRIRGASRRGTSPPLLRSFDARRRLTPASLSHHDQNR